MRLIIYGRVSTEDQAEYGTGLETQGLECREFAERIGAVVVGTETDPGVSGSIYPRPGLERALERIERREADGLLAHRVDRIGRKLHIPPVVLDRLQRASARLLTVQDGEVNDQNILMFSVRCGMAQADYQQLIANMRAGKRRLAESGLTPTRHTPPYGYHIVRKIEEGAVQADAGKYRIIEEQAQVVRQIFTLYAAGVSLRKIADILMLQGTPPPGQAGMIREKPLWHRSTLMRILDNPAYRGTVVWGQYEHHGKGKKHGQPRTRTKLPESAAVSIEVPAIVEADLWRRCQERRQENKANTCRKDRSHLLTGLIRCPACGSRLTVAQGRVRGEVRYYYKCLTGSARADNAGVKCPRQHHREDVVAEWLLRALERIVDDPGFAPTAFAFHAKQTGEADAPAELSGMRARLAELHAQEEATARAQVSAIRTGARAEVYEGMLREISEERRQIEQRLASATTTAARRERVAAVDIGAIAAFVAGEILEAMRDTAITDAEKNDLLRRTVQAIVPVDGGGYRITLRPFSSSDDGDLVAAMCITATSNTISARFEEG